MARILCTGGAGYLGSVLVPMLVRQAHMVTVVDDFRYDNHLALAEASRYGELKIIKADVRDHTVIGPLLPKHDIIIMLAGLVGAPLCDLHPNEAWRTNQLGVQWITYQLSPAQRIIYPNSNSGYGRTGDKPVTESAELNPISHYGQTKVLAEAIVLEHANATSLRLATVFGASPRMRTDLLVNDFVLRATRERVLPIYEPMFRRSIVHVTDVAAAFEAVLYKEGRSVYNVVGQNVTKLQIAEAIREKIPGLSWCEVEGKDPDQRDYAVDGSKIMRETAWEPRISLDHGIDELIRFYAGFPHHRDGNI